MRDVETYLLASTLFERCRRIYTVDGRLGRKANLLVFCWFGHFLKHCSPVGPITRYAVPLTTNQVSGLSTLSAPSRATKRHSTLEMRRRQDHLATTPHKESRLRTLEWIRKHSRSVAVFVTAGSVLMLGHSAVHAAVDGTVLADQTNSFLSSLAETGFYQAFSLVFLSEIGDKTFFIAGLLAMKTSRFISFIGSMAALAAMTVLSVLIGQVFQAVPSGFGEGIPLDDIAAAIAFAFFGVKTLMEALQMEEGESVMDEELADAQDAVDSSRTVKEVSWTGQLISIFTLVFAAEFGDRSFLSTIALSAAQNPVSVAGGAIAAHGVATGIAVSTGSLVAKYISERVVGLIGGSLFIVFALTTVLGIF